MDEIVKEFLQESRENLDRLDHEFVQLEAEPANRELLKSIFRTIHTIKGTCGFLGFSKLETLTHAGESLLALLRDGALQLTEEYTDVLLEMVDAIRNYLHQIETTETEGDCDTTELIARLKQLQQRANSNAGSAPTTPSAPTAPQPNAPTQKQDAAPTPPTQQTAPLPTSPSAQEKNVASPNNTERVEAIAKETPVAENKDATIRVDVNLLEKQMNLVSELVILRNRLLQLATDSNERNLNTAARGLNYVTSELRKNVMKTRMQPVSRLFDKLPRILRDVAKDRAKRVRLETQGGETELDKSLLEAIKDPVTHILRNSVDHGVESPEQRRKSAKSEEGTVQVRAYHEGGNFHLEIADDGAGIDPLRVKQKAIDKGLITAAAVDKMTDTEILNLIFLPGLSTAEKVTNVSGRGVGMDVVKTNVERIGGRTKLESAPRKGTTVHLEIPLTLATIPSLTVVSGGSVFAIPQTALVEMLALDAEDAPKFIESIDGVSVFRFRGTVLPLLYLREELKLNSKPADGSIVKLVIVRTEGRQIALRVDAIRNTEEIVIKPLDKRFKSIALYSGAAVLGDGRVALILDIPAFVRRAGVIAQKQLGAEENDAQKQREKLSLLLLGGSDGERMAVPLEYVKRLEEFAPSAKEPMGELTVIQYRDDILPIVHIESLLDERRAAKRTEDSKHPAAQDKFSAIVVRMGVASNVILEVHRILGIVKVEIIKLTPPSRAGVRGSMVIQERVTELLDLPALLAKTPSLEERAKELVASGMEH